MARESREEVTSRILQAAIECILKYGVDMVQISQIAACANLSVRTISRYYPEKDTMLAEAATQYLQSVYQTFIDEYRRLPKDGLSGRDKLILFLTSQRDYCKVQSVEAMMMIDLRYYRIRHCSAQAIWSVPGGDRTRRLVLDCIEEGKQDGTIRRDIDPVQTSVLLSSTYNGVMQAITMAYRSIMSEENKQPVYETFDRYIEMVQRYLRP